ncbi:MAG: diacylglycerol/lipid kinase family protein [Sphingomonas parapaucimobilis]
MRRYWLVTNAGSGSTAADGIAQIERMLAAQGRSLVGRGRFPGQAIPLPMDLDAAGATLVVLLAGDGTVNAALTALDGWSGSVLILPGGTMNLLARQLHGDISAGAILERLEQRPPRRIALPYVTGDGHRAYAGLILGPVTRWVHAREAARAGRPGRLLRAIGQAWRRTFERGLRLQDMSELPRAYQAVFVQPGEAAMTLTAVDARRWRHVAELGWAAIRGDWTEAKGVTRATASSFRLADRKPGLALFDGEPRMLAPRCTITTGRTGTLVLATDQTPSSTVRSSSEGS